jgi:hypothetical protein
MPVITPELKDTKGKNAFNYVTAMRYRGYLLVPDPNNVSYVAVYDERSSFPYVTALHTDVALATIDNWLCPP